MNNLYTYAKQSSIPSIFPYSLVFPHYESLGQIRIEICLLILLLTIGTFILILLMFISLRMALLISLHILLLLTGTFACLYVFHNLSFNFANALWFHLIPIIFLDPIIHASFNIKQFKCKYNRIIFSFIIPLIIFFCLPIETYIYRIICYSLIYQSILCLILINLILPSWFYVIEIILNKENKKNKENKENKENITSTIMPDRTQTAGAEMQNLVCELDRNTKSSI